MGQEAFNLLSAIVAVAGFIVTSAGLYALYFQIVKLREATWSNTHSKLCDQSFELIRFLSEAPSTYAYFYERKSLQPNTPDRVHILYAAEAIANFLEHLILQRNNLPQKQWEVWKRFIHSTFEASVVVQNFIQEHNDWYSDELVEIAMRHHRTTE
jgi:hypothetical protein